MFTIFCKLFRVSVIGYSLYFSNSFECPVSDVHCIFLSLSSVRYWMLTVFSNSFRLVWALQNVPQLKGALAKDDVLFGTVDTWLLHKFSGGKLHLTDISNAAATGLFVGQKSTVLMGINTQHTCHPPATFHRAPPLQQLYDNWHVEYFNIKSPPPKKSTFILPDRLKHGSYISPTFTVKLNAPSFTPSKQISISFN